MIVLGLSCFYHDSSACIVKDGVALAAAQEERFSRIRNTAEFPIQAINFCVQQAQISFDDIDVVAFYEKPFLKFSRAIVDHLVEFPFSFGSFMRTMPKWLDDRLSLPLTIERELGFRKKVFFVKHHLSHAASAFLPSPFERAAILTADGVGEWATLSCGRGDGTEIKIAREIRYPDSLGMLYTAFTVFLGFDANGGEGKTMGLSGYGEPVFLAKLEQLIQIREDGSFRLDARYFSFRAGSRMWSRRFEEEFGPPRLPGQPLEQRHHDLAASVQAIIEKVIVLNARILQKETGLQSLCLAGGVALNCLANHKILEKTDFREVYIQPAAGDAGGALGAALYATHCLLGNPKREPATHSYLGPSFSEREILKSLSSAGVRYRKLDDASLVAETAKRIAANQAIGWFQGRMEFGPRALGCRSILGNPGHPGMKDLLNERIKKRESFRPFAPMVLEERAQEFFELRCKSPYMLLAAPVRPSQRARLPAVTHVDGTARVQTVDRKSNPLLRALLEEFDRLTGLPILINTSFNRKGEPVVCRPEEALDCFVNTGMDALAIGPFLVERELDILSAHMSEL